jgi:hypothetical protein
MTTRFDDFNLRRGVEGKKFKKNAARTSKNDETNDRFFLFPFPFHLYCFTGQAFLFFSLTWDEGAITCIFSFDRSGVLF